MAARSATPQPLWALVPTAARARYLRRTATAILDELEGLADALADTVGQPRTEAMLAELLPSVGGLHDLADHGPRVLRDRRLGRIPALRAGRRSLLVQAPRGTVGVRGGTASPWAEPVLETAAALLAGNAVVLSTPLGERVRAAFERGGVPLELITLVPPGEDLSALADARRRHAPAAREEHDARARRRAAGPHRDRRAVGRVRRRRPPPRRGRPPRRGAVGGRAADRGGRGGRAAAAPRRPAAARDRGRPAALARDPRARRGAGRGRRSRAAPRCCAAARSSVAGVPGRVLRPRGAARRAAGRAAAARAGARPGAGGGRGRRRRRRRSRSPQGAPAVSVWGGDRARGERVARTLGAEVAWVNEHGHSIPGAAVRLAGHVDAHRLASQPTRLRSARWLPYDPALVRASTATARLQHGRENERLGVLRSGRACRSPAPRRASRARRWGANGARPRGARRGSAADARAAAGRRRA